MTWMQTQRIKERSVKLFPGALGSCMWGYASPRSHCQKKMTFLTNNISESSWALIPCEQKKITLPYLHYGPKKGELPVGHWTNVTHLRKSKYPKLTSFSFLGNRPAEAPLCKRNIFKETWNLPPRTSPLGCVWCCFIGKRATWVKSPYK